MSVNSIIDSEVVDIHGSLSLVLKGEDGESAYEVAVRNGFVGTEEEWLNSLKGEADRAEAATAEALVWRNSAKDYAVEAGNHEEAAKGYRNECQTIKDSIAPQVTQAITAIQAEKAEAEAKKTLVDEAAAQAHLDRVQADADAAEVRYLHGETVEQKNIATDAAERARRYAAREFNWEDLNERPTTRDDFPITDVPKVDGTDATGTWDIDISGDAKTVNGHTVAKNVPANAVFTDTTYSEATTNQAGLLSASDKAKLNGIESGAQANTITGVKGSAESSYRIGNVNITKANIGLGNVDNTADSAKNVAYATNAGKVNSHTVNADVPSGAKFTDTTYDVMTSSELSDGTSTQGKLIDAHTLATFILTVAADVVNNAPEALDTLAELAQALGDDPNFATTVMNEIGKKLDKSGGVITGNLTVNGTLTGNVVGSASTVNGHTVESDVPANAVFTDTTYSNATTSKAGLMSSADKTKLNGIESGAQVNTITGVKGNSESTYRTGNVNITKANIGLGNVDNTADSAKNVAYATTAGDASTVSGFTVGKAVPSDAKFTDTTYNNATISTAGLMSAADKKKLDGIASGAQVNSVTGVKGNSESSYRTGNVNITKANIGLGNVDNTADNEKSVAYAANAGTVNNHAVNADVPSDAKFTDTKYSAMSANEATTGTATTARTITAKVLADYVAACIANLVNSAPATLDTLKELADALGDDPNFATTMTNALAEKLGKNETAKNAEKVNNLTVQTAVPANAKFTDTTYSNFVKSGSGAKAGLVPAPSTTAGTTKYLREDGTWQVPPDNNTTYTAASATPLANGTAAVGTSAKYAREDHVHPLQTSVSGSSGSCTGNAATATKATQDSNGRNISTGYMWRGSYERIEGTSEEHKDLNNYKSAGFYNVKVGYVDNLPTGIADAVVLLVYPWNSDVTGAQEITEVGDRIKPRRWFRSWKSSTWRAWQQVACMDSDIKEELDAIKARLSALEG